VLEIILLAVAGYAAFKWYTIKQGKLYVRAYAYLRMLDEGLSPAEANGCALRFLSKHSEHGADTSLIHEATAFAASGRRQLPTIAAARQRGFIG
jgi:hypothetical protein